MHVQQNIKNRIVQYLFRSSWVVSAVLIFIRWRNVCVKADSHIACRTHAVPLPCRAVNSHMPCRAPAMLRQCRVLRECPRGSRKYPNC